MSDTGHGKGLECKYFIVVNIPKSTHSMKQHLYKANLGTVGVHGFETKLLAVGDPREKREEERHASMSRQQHVRPKIQLKGKNNT